MAILTGDLLFARASGRRRARRRGGAAAGRTFERLCLGQLHETVGPRRDDDPVEHYLQVLADKTGSLIATSARFGAMFAGCAPEVLDVVADYGERVGVAFQLADDVIDLASDEAPAARPRGPTCGSTFRRCPSCCCAGRSPSPGTRSRGNSWRSSTATSPTTRVLADAVARLAAHPATEQAREEAVRWAGDAVAALAPLPPSPAHDALRAYAEAVVARTA